MNRALHSIVMLIVQSFVPDILTEGRSCTPGPVVARCALRIERDLTYGNGELATAVACLLQS